MITFDKPPDLVEAWQGRLGAVLNESAATPATLSENLASCLRTSHCSANRNQPISDVSGVESKSKLIFRSARPTAFHTTSADKQAVSVKQHRAQQGENRKAGRARD